MRKAINLGGSTLRNYVSTDGTIGHFQNNFKVYNRDGLEISGYKIKRIIQYGRSTFYCPDIQLISKNRKKHKVSIKVNFIDNNILQNISCYKMSNHKSAKKRTNRH